MSGLPQKIEPPISGSTAERNWRAAIDLALVSAPHKTVLSSNRHYGPLRVQRPFYPERDGCAHIYLLHPPGGMVVGDRLDISARIDTNAKALITTPSASKFYRVDQLPEPQIQNAKFLVASGGQFEWLPQETIVFEGANGLLNTEFDLASDAQLCTWDIVVLGRPAAGEGFNSGLFSQNLSVKVEGRLRFIERNRFAAGSDFLLSEYGMQSQCTVGTFLANVKCSQDDIDEIRNYFATALKDVSPAHWGISQKEEWLVARYLGPCAEQAKNGFTWLWQQIRPLQQIKPAVVPRIWYT